MNEAEYFSCVEALETKRHLSREQWRTLLCGQTKEHAELLAQKAAALRNEIYGPRVFIRGLIEFTNYCRNDCYYCGIRKSNAHLERYRLTKEEILSCCQAGHALGFRTFVLQGGEDPWFTDEKIVEIVRAIRQDFPDCAITLSLGEKEKESFIKFKEAGADRYLLRHETANEAHYRQLHPAGLSLSHRKQCLRELKELGFQTGAGFMVGSPGQTVDTLIDDLLFLEELQPEMVGIGPFIPHHDTPFAKKPAGSLDETLYLLSLIRILMPQVLLPATTALGTIAPNGREEGLRCGANVVMPNLSPVGVRRKYMLYDHKICTGHEAAECAGCLNVRVASVGLALAVDRGDHINYKGAVKNV